VRTAKRADTSGRFDVSGRSSRIAIFRWSCDDRLPDWWGESMMKDLIFESTRFDPDISSFHGLAKAMADDFGYKATLAIDRRLANLLRLRVAQLNPCSYCLILHNGVAIDSGIDPAVVAHLPSWRHSSMFTDAEIAALSYCEALTNFDHAEFDRIHRSLSTHFSMAEIAEIAAVIINMNVWTRLKLAQGAVPAHNTDQADGAP
jgi:AhpD family alkylhydroperoxidase